MSRLAAIDAIVNSPRYTPRWGFHDDHRRNDRTAAYLPAIQQVRSEFLELVDVLIATARCKGRCLQLGIGECEASHDLWDHLFDKGAVTIDWRVCLKGSTGCFPGADTSDIFARDLAKNFGPYTFLFIDAGHSLLDVSGDYAFYGPMVSPGGIIAFHDALKRPGFEEVEVWRYMEELEQRMQVNLIGDEVGVAWIVKQ